LIKNIVHEKHERHEKILVVKCFVLFVDSSS